MSNYQYPLTNDDINMFLEKPIYHRSFNDGLKFILRAYNSYGRTPLSYYIIGESGVGKSKLAQVASEKILKQSHSSTEAIIMPVVFVSLEQGALPDDVRKDILKVLNVDPSGYSGDNLKTLFKKQIEVCQVRIIFFDEFHHLLRVSDKNVNRNAANFIKTVIDLNIPVILFGISEGEKLFKLHSELRSRVKKGNELELMSIDEPQYTKYFTKFISERMKGFPLETVNLSTAENIKRLFLATRGNLRLFNTFLSEVLAEYRKGNEKLTLEHYQSVYTYTREEPLFNGKGQEIKPFTDGITVITNKLLRMGYIRAR
jgi:chromosomal replication initiation ATPase DnaA